MHRHARTTFLAALLLAGCDPVADVREYFGAATPREAYVQRLTQAGLAGSAAARDWLAAGDDALGAAALVELPYEESGYLAPTEPGAVGIRFRAVRGERIRIAVTLAPDSGALVFLDLFRPDSGSTAAPEHVLSADSAERAIELEPRRAGEYILRVQPELLRGGRYTVRITNGASLAFPVAGRGRDAVRSVFGDPRDAGARDHHGIDIFAPRGTPVVAAAAGYVRRVNETPRGGKVVWLRDERRGISLYYAHLDSQLVSAGAEVAAGDTLGLVGNTGNARTTPPHLHFGIYSRGEGPIDPLPFVYRPRRELPALAADTSVLGEWLRADGDDVRLRAGPAADARVLAELPRQTALRVAAATGDWYRVRLPDGRTGFIAASVTRAAAEPVARATATEAAVLHEEPRPDAVAVANVAEGEPVEVYGRFGEYLLVRANGEHRGWLHEDAGGR